MMRFCFTRKFTLPFFCFTTLVLFFFLAENGNSQANPEEKHSIYKSERVSIAPVIDGYLDDPAWQKSKPEKLQWNFSKNQVWNRSTDFEGVFASVWHNDTLYLAVKLEDNYLTTKQKNVLKQDRLEIHFDFDEIGKKHDQSEYLLIVGSDEMKKTTTLNTLLAWNKTGKSLELQLSLKAKPNKGDQAYFAIFYHDVDGDTVQQTVGWPNNSANQLAKLIFTKTLKIDASHKSVQWGRIKSLY